MCHQPQLVDADTGNLLDFKVMLHKIHMGSSLPSVIAGTPYQIIGRNGSVNDYSKVVFPAMAQRCTVCHDQTTGAAQATAYLTEPTRVTCGSCHDDVNFATGANHPAGAYPDDTKCSTCHVPQGTTDFDASIIGAHVVPTDSSPAFGAQGRHRECHEWNCRQPAHGDLHVDEQRRKRGPDLRSRFVVADHGGANNRLRLYDFRQCHVDARLRNRERNFSQVQRGRQLHLHVYECRTRRGDGNICDRPRGPPHGNGSRRAAEPADHTIWGIQSGQLLFGGWIDGRAAASGRGADQLQPVPLCAFRARDITQQHLILRHVPQPFEYRRDNPRGG